MKARVQSVFPPRANPLNDRRYADLVVGPAIRSPHGSIHAAAREDRYQACSCASRHNNRLGAVALWARSAMAEFRWLGHNCFRIRAREASVLTDPVDRSTGYAAAKQTVDVVTISHEHQGHTNLGLIKSEYQVVRGPGEYEMHDIFITGIRTYHDAEKGKIRGHNTVYLLEVEGMRICHLGDLGHPLTEEHTEALSNVDVLLVPAGGGDVLSPAVAAEVVATLEPKLVIPMQYRTEIGDTGLGPVDEFCKHLGIPVPEAEDKLTLRSSELSEVMRLVVLRPESEPVRR